MRSDQGRVLGHYPRGDDGQVLQVLRRPPSVAHQDRATAQGQKRGLQGELREVLSRFWVVAFMQKLLVLQFQCEGEKCSGKEVEHTNGGANRFNCFSCDYDLCADCLALVPPTKAPGEAAGGDERECGSTSTSATLAATTASEFCILQVRRTWRRATTG